MDNANVMNTEIAVKNIDNLIASARLTRQEHVTLQQCLAFLHSKAVSADKAVVKPEEIIEEKLPDEDGD